MRDMTSPTHTNLTEPMTGETTMNTTHQPAALPALDLEFYAGDAHVLAVLPAADSTETGTGVEDTTGTGTGRTVIGNDPVTGTPLKAPAAAPQSIDVQLGAGAIVIGVIVAAWFMIKHKKWTWAPVLTGVVIGTVSAGAGAGSIMVIPSTLSTSLLTAFGNALGGLA